jgi:hypothetical protein
MTAARSWEAYLTPRDREHLARTKRVLPLERAAEAHPPG